MATVAERWFPWALRATWVLVAVLGAPAIDGAVDGRSDAVGTAASVGAGALWLIGVAAMAVPSVIGLTATRAVVPLAPVAAVVALVAGADAVDGVALLASGVVACALAGAAETGRAFVQASAYGDEDRHPLRPPFGYAVASAASWVLWAGALLAGPLLLAARSWIAGLAVTAVAVALTAVLPRRWHRLARRWLVLVPVGVVLHDHLVLAETLMVRRTELDGLRLAPAGTDALDLTGPATGHAVELSTIEPVTALLAPTRRGATARPVHLTALLAAPTRPGRLLRAAAARRLRVG